MQEDVFDPDGRPDATRRPPSRRHGLWWLLAAAALPWLAVAAVLAATGVAP